MSSRKEISYWIFPVSATPDDGSEKIFRALLTEKKMFGLSRQSGNRTTMVKPGDRICFYTGRKGIIADALVSSPIVQDSSKVSLFHPYAFGIDDVSVYIENPIPLDSSTRKKLDAFKGKDPNGIWGWFVQIGRLINKHDFDILTNRRKTKRSGHRKPEKSEQLTTFDSPVRTNGPALRAGAC